MFGKLREISIHSEIFESKILVSLFIESMSNVMYKLNILINTYIRICGKNIEKATVCVLVPTFYRTRDVTGLTAIWVWHSELDRYTREYSVDLSG